MYELLQEGGAVMYVILGCSVIALGTILERFIYYVWTQDTYKSFLRQIKK